MIADSLIHVAIYSMTGFILGFSVRRGKWSVENFKGVQEIIINLREMFMKFDMSICQLQWGHDWGGGGGGEGGGAPLK